MHILHHIFGLFPHFETGVHYSQLRSRNSIMEIKSKQESQHLLWPHL